MNVELIRNNPSRYRINLISKDLIKCINQSMQVLLINDRIKDNLKKEVEELITITQWESK